MIPELSRRAALRVLPAVATGIGPLPAIAQAGRDPAGDSEIAAAIETARRSLPQFWARFAANEPHETSFALKVVTADQAGIEHLWLSQLRRRGGRLFGTIDTAPRVVKSVAQGQNLEIRDGAIVDWMFFRNGKIVGNHTGRALLRRLPAEQAERLQRLYE